MHGHQFDGRHAQRFQVRNLLDHAEIGSRTRGTAGRAGREAGDVHLVDDRLAHRAAEMAVPVPIEMIVDDDTLRRVEDAVRRGQIRPRERLRIRIDQPRAAVETVPLFGVERAVGLEVVQSSGLEARHEQAPGMTPAVGFRVEVNHFGRVTIGHIIVNQQAHRGGGAADDDELHSVLPNGRAERQGVIELQRRMGIPH